MTHHRTRFAMPALAALLSFAAPVQAQDSALAPTSMKPSAPIDPSSDVVVTGKAEAPPAQLRQQAHAITSSGLRYSSPLAMFQEDVCPGILGMPAEMAEIMVDRIRQNAERVGLKTAANGSCQPNIMVIFVRNGQAVVKELAKKRPYLFKQVDPADVRALVRDSGPVHSWSNTILRSRQGDILQGDRNATPSQVPILNVAQSQSHIFLAHRIDIANAIILIDIPAIDGMSVVQIADYVTMRTFARTQPVTGESAASTILNLFDGGKDVAHPLELTNFDLAYLRAVYEGIGNLNAASKLASIDRKLHDIQFEKSAEAGE